MWATAVAITGWILISRLQRSPYELAPSENGSIATSSPPIPPEVATRSEFERDPAPRGHRDLLVSVAAVAAMAVLSTVRGVWILEAAALLLLLSVPGLLAVRAARVEPGAVRAFPVYVLGASLLVLTGSGLAVDLLGPVIGISRPLETAPLLVSLIIVCAALIAAAVPGKAPYVRDYVHVRIRIRQAWPLLLPVLAWAGAGRLTNGHSATVAVIAVAVTGAVLLYGSASAHRWSVAQSATLIFGASLALIWGFSLRGHFLYGYDITSEYHTFITVLDAGRWHTSHRNDAYGAMLSLTILPSSLTRLTGASPLLVLKVIYPCMFALFPTAVFLLATRVLRRTFAYIAALFLVVQSYLFQQLPAIARQEIGLLFFVCLVGAILDTRLARRQRTGLITMFAVGMAVSHYSTTYLAIGVLALALILELVRGRVSSTPRLALAPFAIAFVVAAGTAGLWYGAVTHSAQQLSKFVSQVENQGLAILPNAGGHSGVNSYLDGNVGAEVGANNFEALAHADYTKGEPYIHPLPGGVGYVLHNARVPSAPIASHPLLHALTDEQSLIGLIAEVLATLGALFLCVRRGVDERARGIALLGVSTLFALVAIRFSGTVADDYGQGRAFLQAMVPLSICLAWALQWSSARKRWTHLNRTVIAAFPLALIVLLLTTSGLRGALLGGGTSTNLANSGEDYQRFYITTPELAAARWLNAAAPVGNLVYADKYGQLRITAATGRSAGVLTQLTPATLDRSAWIFADTPNFVDHLVRGTEGSDTALYAWPRFISHNWNLVYSNGFSGVYARSH
jgi:uncharacterized membrane protein